MKKTAVIIASILIASIMTACGSTKASSEVKQTDEIEETTIETTTVETDTTTGTTTAEIDTTTITESSSNSITTYENEREWHGETYLYADFDTYNSPAEENGLKDTKIYIVCNEFGTEGYHYIDSPIPYAIAKSADGGSWEIGLALFSGMEGESYLWESQKDKLIGAGQTIIYGVYLGYSNKFNRPLIMAEQIENENGSFNFYENIGADLVLNSSSPDETTTTTTTKPEKTTTTTTTKEEISIGKKNALKSAKSYLSFTSFSYQGLIEQLEYEGYSHDDSVYAVDNCGADWFEQAAKKAQEYLDYTSFSRDSLIEQLEYEGFTTEQAEYGVNAVGY